MEKAPSIFSRLNRRVTTTLGLLWITSMVVIVAAAAMELKNYTERTSGMVFAQVSSLAMAADFAQDLFVIQRELSRFVRAVEMTQNHQVAVNVTLNDRLIAEATPLIGILSQHFVSARSKSIDMPSGGQLSIFVTIDYRKKISETALTLVVLTILLALSAAVLHRGLKMEVSSLSKKIGSRMRRVSKMAENIPHQPVDDQVETATDRELIELDSAITTLGAAIATYDRQLEDSHLQLKAADVKSAKQEVITEMTRMLAHDIKHPFTALKMAIEAIENSSDPERIKFVAKSMVSEVQQSLRKVETMTAEITEFGDVTKQVINDICIETVFKDSWREVSSLAEDPLSPTLSVTHRQSIRGDELKMGRAFCNLIVNAYEANKGARIWFSTKDITHAVEVRIGNSGTFIPEDEREAVFEANFSRRKPRGTGLGLAIVRRIVSNHGGMIRCVSDQNWGTEFIISLPTSGAGV